MEIAQTQQLIVIAAIVWLGYAGSKLFEKINLPTVSGFLAVGAIFGPQLLNIVNLDILHRLSFFEAIALGIITFLIGENLDFRKLKEDYLSIFSISVFEILLTLGATYLVLYLISGSRSFALLMAIIATSTAPATLIAVKEKMQAEGRLTTILTATVAANNIFCITAFSLALPFIINLANTTGDLNAVATASLRHFSAALLIAVATSIVFALLASRVETSSEFLLFVSSHILMAIALSYFFGASPMLTTLLTGVITVNLPLEPQLKKRIFVSIKAIAEPVYLMFFVLAGASLKFNLLLASGSVLFGYILARSAGKIAGPFLGSLVTGIKLAEAKSVSLGFVSQSAIAIGLSLIARDKYPAMGDKITTVVLGAVIVFEIVGPYLLQVFFERTREAGKAAETEAAENIEKEVDFSNILVPVGTKLPSARRAAMTFDIARKMNAEVIFFSVRKFSSRKKYDNLNSDSINALSRFEELAKIEEIPFESVLQEAENVPEAICGLARQRGVDMVIMGATVRSGMLGRFAGSGVTQKVMQELKCPVLIIPE